MNLIKPFFAELTIERNQQCKKDRQHFEKHSNAEL